MTQKHQALDLTKSIHNPTYALTQFTPGEIDTFWPSLDKMLNEIPHTWRNWTKEYIREGLENNHLQCWGIGPPPQAILVFFTQINTFPTGSILSVCWGAGTFHEDMMPLLQATLVNYAQLNGCRMVEVRGREGWDKIFQRAGLKREHVTWSFPVSNLRVN